MNGTKKQNILALKIKAKFVEQAKPFRAMGEIQAKIVDQVLAIDNVNFWIDYRKAGIGHVLTELCKGTLSPKGIEFDTLWKVDQQTGIISESKRKI
jgi:hypothetical protein